MTDARSEEDRPVTLRHRIEYAATRVFAAIVACAGVRGAYLLADLGGWLIYLVDGRHRRIAQDNLRSRFLDADGRPPPEREVRRIARASLQHLVRNGVEMVLVGRLLARDGFDALVETEGLHHLREAADGPGCIFVTGHLGNWEVLGMTCSHLGIKGRSVYRPLDNPLLDRWVRSLRSGMGQDLIPKAGAVRGLLRGIKEGRVNAILIDQDARRRGIFVPFFGAPASTIPTPAELAIRTGASIITGFALRVGPGFRYHQRYDPPLEMPATGDSEADVRAIMTELNRRLEAAVRSAPEQWLWAHRRWKTRPPEEATRER